MEILREITNQKIDEIYDDIVGYMVKKKISTTKESTCDYIGWDREKHRLMPQVADRLRKNGFSVTSSVNHGVTDWIITFKG